MSSDLLGYVNMAIGLVGIVLTLFTAPTVLHLGAKVRTEALPAEFQGIGGVLRAVGVLLLLTTFGFLLGLGMTMTLVTVTKTLGAVYPTLVAVLMVGALFSTAASLALALYRNPLCIPGVVGVLGLATLALIAALTEDRSPFWIAFVIFMIAFSIMGFAALAAMEGASETPAQSTTSQ
jgi:hypothetical protein